MDNEELKLGNINFMIYAACKISSDNDFKNTLHRASRSFDTKVYYGLQGQEGPQTNLGYIFIDPVSAQGLIEKEPRELLFQFMEGVHSRKNGYYPKEDSSLVEIPFEDKGNVGFSIFLDIIAYANTLPDFSLVENPLDIPLGCCLERIAHFGMKVHDEYLEEQEKLMLAYRKEYLGNHFRKNL